MIDVMTFEQHVQGTVLCQQCDLAEEFYIIMEGECAAFVDTDMDNQFGRGISGGKEERVGTLTFLPCIIVLFKISFTATYLF